MCEVKVSLMPNFWAADEIELGGAASVGFGLPCTFQFQQTLGSIGTLFRLTQYLVNDVRF